MLLIIVVLGTAVLNECQRFSLAEQPSAALEPADQQSEAVIIGRWFDDSPGITCFITIFRKDGTLFIEHEYRDGSRSINQVVETKASLGRRFDDVKGSRTGDHWIIGSDGNLQIRDKDGLIATAMMRAFPKSETLVPPITIPRADNSKTKGKNANLREESRPASESKKRGWAAVPKAAVLEHVKVSITDAAIGKVPFVEGGASEGDLCIIHILVENTSTDSRFLYYQTWSTGLPQQELATLKDEVGHDYKRMYFGMFRPKGRTTVGTVYPGKPLEDVLIFEAPSESAKTLVLELPGDNIRLEGTLRFRIAFHAHAKEPLKLVTNSIGMKLKRIPAGLFEMGPDPSDKKATAYEGPRHPVMISRPYYLGTHEVTQSEYRAITGSNPSHFAGSDQNPVEMVSWYDAVEFCNALSRKEGLKPFYKVQDGVVTVPTWVGDGYRLPTEAEWEYACRAGTSTNYWFGNDPAKLRDHAWVSENSSETTHKVGSSANENPWGLFDMLGNVSEWCWDVSDQAFYWSDEARNDPRGLLSSSAEHREIRGGSSVFLQSFARSDSRLSFNAKGRYAQTGFRVARDALEDPKE
jgi:formylglycine-generating enzyme required for sulfatase activity